MLNRSNTVIGIMLLLLGTSSVWAGAKTIVGMVTETRGSSHWANDSHKKPLEALAELPENSSLVLLKDSKVAIVYLKSGQQFELLGPAVVKFKITQPIALSGTQPKKIGAASPSAESKVRIDPKSVQTAGKTLVSTDKKIDPSMPVAAAPSPAPAMSAPPAPVSASSQWYEYEAAKQAAASGATAARADKMRVGQAETEVAAARRAEAEAAAKARQAAELNSPDKDAACVPVGHDAATEGSTADQKPTTADVGAKDCPMITF